MSEQLNATEMLERAQTDTGLSDYGDRTLPERFTSPSSSSTASAWTRTAGGRPRTYATGF